MSDFSEEKITSEVVKAFEQTPNPRLKQIMQALVRHLHGFIREVELTEQEWQFAIDYLTRTGRPMPDGRQEFILLSDTLGVSVLVDALNHRRPEGATETTMLGPFYVPAPELPLGFDLGRGLKGEPLFVEGTVLAAGGAPLANAAVDVWQSDSEGFYDVQLANLQGAQLRGRFRTDSKGRYHFWSIMPCLYPIPLDGTVGEMFQATARPAHRPAHVHFMIAADGHETLVTHIFVAGDPHLASDPVFSTKESLTRPYTQESPGQAPDGTRVERPWRKLIYNFGLKPVAARQAA
jgi:hydroxyquinol 1,2-dioxygenase